MSNTLEQIVQDCFDQNRPRDCRYCLAFHKRNSTVKCCFGHLFEEGDHKCLECPHNEDCSMETMEFEREKALERPRRVSINRPGNYTPTPSRLPVYNQPQQRTPALSVPRVGTSLIQPQQPTQQQPQVYQQRTQLPEIVRPGDEYTGFWKRMGLHAMWGAGEGMLEMLLGFLRTRRPY